MITRSCLRILHDRQRGRFLRSHGPGRRTFQKTLIQAAEKEGKKLKFVARYQQGKASVGLQHIDPQHDLYHLYGKDNVVLFYTDRYPQQPLVIKGAGAGAEVTASGVFADIDPHGKGIKTLYDSFVFNILQKSQPYMTKNTSTTPLEA